MSAQGTAPLVIERLTVRADRVVCDVILAPGVPRRTTPELAARVRAAHPHVPRHACVNDEGDTFAAVMDHTSLPHLLEHLVIDFQTRAAVRRGDGAEAGSAAAYADAGSAHPPHLPFGAAADTQKESLRFPMFHYKFYPQ